jgi:ABC-type transporter Mla MlaB component
MSYVTHSETVHSQIRGPLARRDLPGLYARICAHLAATQGGTLVCDVAEVAADGVAVEALARMQLGARRHGCRVLIANAPTELDELIQLCGLEEALRAA